MSGTEPAGVPKRSRVPRRAPRACQQCRVAKVRCSGTSPCTRCARRSSSCIFPEDDPKVVVSEKYLLEIERQAARARHQNSSRFAPTSPEPSTAERSRPAPDPEPWHSPRSTVDEAPVDQTQLNQTQERLKGDTIFTSNPLVGDMTYLKDPAGRFRFMGPTSTWSFVRRLISMVEQALPQSLHTPPDPFNTEGAAMRLVWDPIRRDEKPDVRDVPSIDYATYLFHTVKFRLGNLGELIDQSAFFSHLEDFDKDPHEVAKGRRLWLAQYFLVIALGEALLNGGANHQSDTLVGSGYAARALAIIPDSSQLHEGGLLAIGVLALAGLYLHSIDMRVSAFQYVGQALRLSFVQGIHRDMPADIFTEQYRRRCCGLWWAVYILDRRFSAQMGGPSSIQDKDITTKLPCEEDSGFPALTMTLSIKLYRLHARIVSRVYGVDGQLGKSFVTHMRNTIEDLAKVAEEGESLMAARGAHGVDGGTSHKPPRTVTSLTLMYHHCILQATRPLSMCLMKAFLDVPWGIDRESISAPIISLLKTSVASAVVTLGILRTLKDEYLLDSFLTFDLECAFSATVLLRMMQVCLPELVLNESWNEIADDVIHTMMAQGSVVGRVRRVELSTLQTLLAPLTVAADEGPLHPDDSGTDALPATGDIDLNPVPTLQGIYHGRLPATLGDAAVDTIAPGQLSSFEQWDSGLDTMAIHPDPTYLFDLAVQFESEPELDIIGYL